MIVYHGSLEIVRNPDISHSLRNLDFGKCFYVTSVREQAEKWAARKADLLNKTHGIINVYQFRDLDETCRIKEFADDLYNGLTLSVPVVTAAGFIRIMTLSKAKLRTIKFTGL